MIIFDLDTLANCEHRRHFVDWHKTDYSIPLCKWKPDWQSFYEACEKDKVIEPTCRLYSHYFCASYEVQIWTGRCESTREKTLHWILDNILTWLDPEDDLEHMEDIVLKMRPIGDNTPDDQLKEKWLDELWPKLETPTEENMKKTYYRPNVDFVFDSDHESIKMWRRRGIFVFNCCQHDGEF